MEHPGALAGATGAVLPLQANADGNPEITQMAARRHARATKYSISNGGTSFPIAVKGRVRWALERLCAAGERGCTPITDPAPPWSAYVHILRELGVEIETVHEAHGGEYPGHHGRYVLRSMVAPVAKGDAA